MQKQPYPMVLETIRQEYTYDPTTGTIYRQGRPIGSKVPNKVMVCVAISFPEYLTIFCNLPAHQIAWYLTHGVWADTMIDHIDGNCHNNRLDNLRLATAKENAQNVRKRAGNYTSRYKGVHKRECGWQVTIYTNGKNKKLGVYPTEEEAARVYDTAARRIHGEFARLNFPTATSEVLPSEVEVGCKPTC